MDDFWLLEPVLHSVSMAPHFENCCLGVSLDGYWERNFQISVLWWVDHLCPKFGTAMNLTMPSALRYCFKFACIALNAWDACVELRFENDG